MRSFAPLLIVAMAAVAFAGCHRDQATPADTTPPASQQPSTDATGAGTTASDTHTSADRPPPAPAPPPSQGVSLALVAALDEHEIAAAEQAREKKLHAPVREYADLLHREHSENLAALRAIASGEPPIGMEITTEVHALVGRGKAELDALSEKSGAAYERAWLEAMVAGHVDALALLDTRLIPAAQDESVRNFLNNTRDHMAMHLERGRALLEGKAPR